MDRHTESGWKPDPTAARKICEMNFTNYLTAFSWKALHLTGRDAGFPGFITRRAGRAGKLGLLGFQHGQSSGDAVHCCQHFQGTNRIPARRDRAGGHRAKRGALQPRHPAVPCTARRLWLLRAHTSRLGYDATPANVGRTAQEAADAIAALLERLKIARAAVIGISAAGPTALAFAQRHPEQVDRLVLESALTLPLDEPAKRRGRRLFGRAERLTWGVARVALWLFPSMVIRAMMRELTTLDVGEVLAPHEPGGLRFRPPGDRHLAVGHRVPQRPRAPGGRARGHPLPGVGDVLAL